MSEELILNVESASPYFIGSRAYVTQTEQGAVLTVIDREGTTSATILNGAEGKGIASVILNENYTLTIFYTDGTSATTSSIRGEKGESGVYVGTSEPTDPDVNVWIDTNDGVESVLKVKDNGVWTSIESIKGDAAGFGTVTATVDTNVGTPSVTVTSSGEDTAKNFAFAFHNLGYDDTDLQADFADLEGDFTTLQGQFDTAVAALTVDSEVADIRVGADGTTYTSAGAAVRGQVSDLKSAFNDLSIIENTASDITEVSLSLTSGYMDKSGSTGASSQYSYTQKISVKTGDIVHLRNDSNKREYNQFRYLTAFRGSAVDADKGTNSNSRTYTVPDGITGVILTIDTTAYPSCTVLINNRVFKVSNDAVNVGVADSKNIVDNSFVYTNGLIVEEITVTKNNGYMDQNGVVTATTGMIYTQPIPVNVGDVLTMRNDNKGSLITPMRAITTYDDLMYPISSEGSSSAVNSYTIPSGVAFVVVTIADSTYPNTTILKATGKYLLSDTSLGSDTTEVIETIKNSFNLVNNAFIKEVTPTKATGYMNPDGTVGEYSQFRYTQKIPVKKGDIITMRNDDTGVTPRAMRVITAFNGTVPVVASGTDANVSTYTVPDGINSIVVTVDNSTNPNFTILQSTSGYISKADASNRIPELVLPSKSIAVVGHEWNMYYDNVVDGLTDDYYIFCSGVSGKSYGNFLRFTPSNGDIGTHTITVNLYSKAKGLIVATSSFDLVVIADSAPTKNVIFIGDSLTQEGTYINEIQNVLSNGNIKSVGTRTEVDSGYSGLHHEGRAGWSAYDYVEQSSKSGVANAFWNSNTSAFDFSNYMSVNGFSDIDCVMLNLGTNGVEYTERTCDAISEMITSIHSYDANIKVIVSLITPPATQDGCGNHNGMFDANAYKRNELKLVEKYIELYDGISPNVYVSEPYFNLDRLHDFATTTVPISSRNPNTVVVQNNNVHPSIYGYLKIADAYYNNLLYRL